MSQPRFSLAGCRVDQRTRRRGASTTRRGSGGRSAGATPSRAANRAAGYVFRPADGDEELFLEAGPGAGPESLTQMRLGDVRQILSVARSGLV